MLHKEGGADGGLLDGLLRLLLGGHYVVPVVCGCVCSKAAGLRRALPLWLQRFGATWCGAGVLSNWEGKTALV